MKHLYLGLLFCCTTFFCNAQNSTKDIIIKGTVLDSLTKTPLPYVTVALQNATTKNAIKSTSTKPDGTFSFKVPVGPAYQLTVVSINYKGQTLPVKDTGSVVDIGNINLSQETKRLKEVAVVAVKPLIKQEIDRLTYDVQADPESKTQMLFDILRKVPLLSIDGNDNVQLKGNSSYKILINGRPSLLFAHNPSDIFKTMPAANIRRIEVITIPPAKYDAEGLAGIINIITYKNASDGYNGNIAGRYDYTFGPGGGMSLTLKEGKLGFATYNNYNNQGLLHAYAKNSLNTFGPPTTFLDQSADNSNRNHLYNNSDELSYEIDSLNLVNVSLDYYSYNFNGDNTQSGNMYDQHNNLTNAYQLHGLTTTLYKTINLGFNYQLGFKRNKEQLLTLSYNYAHGSNTVTSSNAIYNRINYNLPDYMQADNSPTNEHTVQVDYAHPAGKMLVEGGVKAIFRNNSSDFESSNLDSLNHIYVANPANSDIFNYQQNIYSVYNSYQLNLKNWGFKGGIRLENTVVDADFISQAAAANQNYTNVIPSIAIIHNFKDGFTVNLGYTNRIQRPSITNLNPFVDRGNPEFVTSGNPNLLPVLNHAFQLNVSKYAKSSVSISLSYSFANNAIQRVTRVIDTVSYTSYENIGSNKNLAANINVSYPITKKLNININSRLAYLWLKADLGTKLYTNSGLTGFFSTYIGYQISSTWSTGLTQTFSSSNVLLQGNTNSYISNFLNVSKSVFNKKATIGFNASNPFQKYRNATNYIHDVAFDQTTNTQNPYRTFVLSFNYRFGNLKKPLKRNQHGISNDDIR